MGPNPMTGVLIRKKTRDTQGEEHHVKTQTQREGGHVRMEAEMGVLLLEANNAWATSCQRP